MSKCYCFEAICVRTHCSIVFKLCMLLSHYDGKTGTEFSKKLAINLKWGIWAQIWAHLCGFQNLLQKYLGDFQADSRPVDHKCTKWCGSTFGKFGCKNFLNIFRLPVTRLPMAVWISQYRNRNEAVSQETNFSAKSLTAFAILLKT